MKKTVWLASLLFVSIRAAAQPVDHLQNGVAAYEEHRRAWREQADAEIQMGHLLAANDWVLKVLAENANQRQAQQQLSDLQSRIRRALEKEANLTSPERFALQGFYAYGQADYPNA